VRDATNDDEHAANRAADAGEMQPPRRPISAKHPKGPNAPPGMQRAHCHGMTCPRRILPGLTFLITRRTLRRTHLLRPDPELNNLFRY
jgi:hypothetical protein